MVNKIASRLFISLLLFAGNIYAQSPNTLDKKIAADPMDSARPYLIALSVADVSATQAWYVEKLGFRIVKSASSPAPGVWFAMLERNGFQLELIGISKSASRSSVLPNPQNVASLQGIFKFAFLVNDLDEVGAALLSKGITFKLKPTTDEKSGTRFFLIEDPDKNTIQFFQRLTGPVTK